MLQILDGCAKNGRHGVGGVRRRALIPFFFAIIEPHQRSTILRAGRATRLFRSTPRLAHLWTFVLLALDRKRREREGRAGTDATWCRNRDSEGVLNVFNILQWWFDQARATLSVCLRSTYLVRAWPDSGRLSARTSDHR